MKNHYIARFLTMGGFLLILSACSQEDPSTKVIGERNNDEVEINLNDYIPEKPKLSSNILISEHSLDGTPTYRPPPTFPPRAEKSGHCVFSLQVNEFGNVESIVEIKCNDDVFTKNSRQNLLKWKFYPKKDDKGSNIAFQYGPQKLIYRLVDEDGKVIPE